MVILQVLSRLIFVFYCFPFADGDHVILIRVGQSKFVTVPIDEDSQERILDCI
jgi:vesicle coat complex subunit